MNTTYGNSTNPKDDKTLKSMFSAVQDSEMEQDFSNLVEDFKTHLWETERGAARKAVSSLKPVDLIKWAVEQDPDLRAELTSYLTDTESAATTDPLSSAQKEILSKAGKLASDRGIEPLQLIYSARESDVALSQLQKNPTKQCWYEHAVAAFIESRVSGSKVFVLSDEKVDVWLDGNGSFTDTKPKPATGSGSKSVDLLIVAKRPSGNVAFLASHKYAREGGGHQDNQKADAIKFFWLGVKAKENGESIPAKVHQLLEENNLSVSEWEPALLLDGGYFSTVEPQTDQFFWGSSDEFVAQLSATDEE